MLIVKVQVNDKQIDEIWIQQIDHLVEDLRIYRIVKPKGFFDYPIKHFRNDGYGPLVIEALRLIKPKGEDAHT